ncbi:hypothetical protein [Nocardia camponoti]|uniref:Uncharacterized protein n=1 Tax=Nocardia camponoti TaxID=1616106 RepID=A0A917QFN5_9NOCA|nr:hypothetical protein [Nocardia camponoti]GGK48479.1 hypothetical protein GCM10011591_19840 [Nocardia camponoti]
MIALFDSKLGQETDNAVSGTAEEIERAAATGKPVHVWFSDEPIDRRTSPAELTRLQNFREELQGKGLLGVYADLNDLAYKVRDAVESDISKLGLSSPAVVRKGEHAMPRLHVEREVDYRGKERTYVVVENKSGATTANELQVDLGEWEQSVYRESRAAFDLPPFQKIRWTAGFHMGLPSQIVAKLKWIEGAEPQSEELPVTLH